MARKQSDSPSAAKKKTSAAPQSEAAQVPPNEIEEAAYYRWLNRGCPEGDSWTDWCEAEKEMMPRKKRKN